MKSKKRYKEKDWILALDTTYSFLDDFDKMTSNLKVLKQRKIKKAHEVAFKALYDLYQAIGKDGI